MNPIGWIAAATIAGGLIGLCQGLRRQAADAGACAVALGLAWWQWPRLAPYVLALWPALGAASWPGTGVGNVAAVGPPAVRPVALAYLFAVLYGLFHALVALYVPGERRRGPARWVAGLLGALQAGGLATLAVAFLPGV